MEQGDNKEKIRQEITEKNTHPKNGQQNTKNP
jgi:hypothetical protein